MLPSEYIKRGWCQLALACDSRGQDVDPNHETACKWGLTGAVYAALWGIDISNVYRYLHVCENMLGHAPLFWNDSKERTKQDVLGLCLRVEKEMAQ